MAFKKSHVTTQMMPLCSSGTRGSEPCVPGIATEVLDGSKNQLSEESITKVAQ